MLCDVCGTDLKGEDGKSLIGLRVSLLGAMADSKVGKRVKEEFGKTDFCICHVCHLKALGVKEKKD